MAAGESLSPYDDITSDELFDSFMDVVSSVEQSFNEESSCCENPYEDISNINGMLSTDINIDIGAKKSDPSQFSSLLPSNDPIHLPLLVKLYKEPIYESCDGNGFNGDINCPIDGVNSNIFISDLDKPVIHKDIDKDTDYEDIDSIITSSPKHIISNRNNEIDVVDCKHKISDGHHADKTSNLDDVSKENSFEVTFNNETDVMETESRPIITDVYATVNKEKKANAIVTDIYAVVCKQNKTTEIGSGGTTELKNNVSNNDSHGLYDVIPSNNNVYNENSDQNDISVRYLPVNSISCKNDYAEISLLKSCNPNDYDISKDNLTSPRATEINRTENEYELITNFKPTVSNSCTNEYSDIDEITPKSPEVMFNAEQIAYGYNKFSKERSDIYQSCIQTIEKNELISPQTPKSSSGKDKRNFFGFGKWKSTEDTSKSPMSPTQSWSADDLRKDSKTLSPPPNCPTNNIPVLCSGYLFKQGGTGFIPKNWRLRWFQLKKDNCLYYYKSEQDQIPIGAVILLKYQVSRAINVNKRFAFKVAKGGARTYYFAANSEDEMKKWMGYLNDAAKYAISDHTSIPECSLKNVSIPAASITEPDCHGFISKQGNIRKTWKKRYCVLKYGCLFYYEDMADKVAIGVFKLHKHTIHKSENTRYGFEAVPPVRKMRTYYFYTNTETDTRRWIEAMRRSISSFQ